MHFRTLLIVGLLAACCGRAAAVTPEGLVYESEKIAQPQSAWIQDRGAPDHWMLWTKEQDIDKKRSGGAVLASPPVTALRAPLVLCAAVPLASSSAADQQVAMARFLADTEGRQEHDFPAWNRFQQIVRDRPSTRRLFAEMLRREREICGAIGNDPQELRSCVYTRLKDTDLPPATLAAVLFAAADRDVKLSADEERQIEKLVRDASVFSRYSVGQPTEHVPALKELLGAWLMKEGHPDAIVVRMNVARSEELYDVLMPLAWQLLRHPERRELPSYGRGPEAIVLAVIVAHSHGGPEHRRQLAAYLERQQPLDGTWLQDLASPSTPGAAWFCPQLRDLALGAIVRLSGINPQQCSMKEVQVRHYYLPESQPAFLFPSTDHRNRGFAYCREHFRELGLEKPPQYEPEKSVRFALVAGSTSIPAPGLPTSRDGKLRLEMSGHTAFLVEVATGKVVGRQLVAGKYEANALVFKCAAFSNDGQFVVTGSEYFSPQRGKKPEESVGEVEIWSATTGERVARPFLVGRVTMVHFDDDSCTIHYVADRLQRDGL